MDYTSILSSLELALSGTSGILAIAALGVVGIIGSHVFRMKSSRSGRSGKSKTYQRVVIAPYVEDEGDDPTGAMMPKFSAHQ